MSFPASLSPAMSPWTFLICSLAGLLFLWQAAWLLDRLWWRPRRLERTLRAQGLRGRPYRFLIGDLMDNYVRKNKEASMPLRCHNIAPYVVPFLHNTVQEHGKTCISWFGPIPKVTIADAELTRHVMSSKSGHFEKLQFRKLSRLLAEGLATYEGEKWVMHRRIVNPAFHLEKLPGVWLNFQLMLPAFSSCCEELVTRWTGSLGSDDGHCELDVCPEFHSLAGDAISRTAFGSSYLEGKRIFELQSEQADRILASVKMIFIPGYLELLRMNSYFSS